MYNTEMNVKVKEKSKVRDGITKVKQKVTDALDKTKTKEKEKEDPKKNTTHTTTTTTTVTVATPRKKKEKKDDPEEARKNQMRLKLDGLVATVSGFKLKLISLKDALKSLTSMNKIPETEETLLKLMKKAGKKHFEDDEFPANAKSLGPGAPSGVQWKRVTELNANASLFVDGFAPGDVIQGTLGDCWFLGSVAVLAVFSKSFLKVFTRNQINPEGSISFRFWRQGEWQVVTIDDRIPCKDGVPIYSRCRDEREMWLCLIEKAYAKFWGGYGALEGGLLTQALADLTGGVTSTLNLSELRADIASGELWNHLVTLRNQGCLMGCAVHSNDGNFKQGIIPNHAYSIMKLKQVGQHRLLFIRNPWGKGEWKGRWSDQSDLWTPDLKKKFKLVNSDDGFFYMCFEDFTSIYNQVYVCQPIPEDQRLDAKGQWKGPTAGGCMKHGTWRGNVQYLLNIKKSTTVTVILEQITTTCNPQRRAKIPAIACYVLKTGGKSGQKLSVEKGDIVNGDLVFSDVMQFKSEVELKADDGPFVLIPCTFDPNQTNQFCLSVCGSHLSSLTPLSSDSTATISSSWTSKSNGGCTNNPTWKTNPKFVLNFTPNSSHVNFSVTIVDSKKSVRGAIGLYVFDNQNFDGSPIATTPFCPGESCISFSVQKSVCPLYLLAATFEKGATGSFDVFVSSHEVASLTVRSI